MKKLRSILALLMVAAMLLSFGVVALADEEPVEEEAIIEVAEEEAPATDGDYAELDYYNRSIYPTLFDYLQEAINAGWEFFGWNDQTSEWESLGVLAAVDGLQGDDLKAELKKYVNCLAGDIMLQQSVEGRFDMTHTYFPIYAEDIKEDAEFGHQFTKVDTENSKPATCTEGGETVYVCAICGEYGYSEEQAATDHSWYNFKVLTPPTCSSEGVMQLKCRYCGITREVPIDKLEHEYTMVITKLPECKQASTTNLASPTDAADFDATDFEWAIVCRNCGEAYMSGSGKDAKALTGKISVKDFADDVEFKSGVKYKDGNKDKDVMWTLSNGAFALGNPNSDDTVYAYGLTYTAPDGTIYAGYDRIKAYYPTVIHVGTVGIHTIKEANCDEAGEIHITCTNCKYDAIVTVPAMKHGFTKDALGYALDKVILDVDDEGFEDYGLPEYVFAVGDHGSLRKVSSKYTDCYDIEETWMCSVCGDTIVGYWVVLSWDAAAKSITVNGSTYTLEELMNAEMVDGYYRISLDGSERFAYIPVYLVGSFTDEDFECEYFIQGAYPAENHRHTFTSTDAELVDANEIEFTLNDILDGSITDIVLDEEESVKEFAEGLLDDGYSYKDDDTNTVVKGIVDMQIPGLVYDEEGIAVLSGNTPKRFCANDGFIVLVCEKVDSDAHEENEEVAEVYAGVLANEKDLKAEDVGKVYVRVGKNGGYTLAQLVSYEASDRPGGDAKLGWDTPDYFKLLTADGLDHQYNRWIQKQVAKDENDNNVYVRTCRICGYEDREVTAYGDPAPCTSQSGQHTPGAWVVEIAATCTDGGWQAKYCTVCNTLLDSEDIPAAGHQYGDYVVTTEADCTNPGVATATCTVCEDATLTKVVPALGHDWAEDVTVDPTCTAGGKTTHTCKRCDEVETLAETEALGHDWQKGETVEPTCTEAGYTIYTCARCNETKQDDVTEALDHDYNSGEVVIPATCTAEGKILYTCGRCGDLKTETTPALGHNPVLVPGTPATAKEDGISDGYVCDRCGETLTPQETIKHNVYGLDASDVEIKDGDVSGTVKVDKKSGDVEDGKLYARFVTNFKRADGTTYSLAVAYQIVDGEVEVPSYDTVDEITEMFVIILNARNSSAAWAENAVDVDGNTATQIL